MHYNAAADHSFLSSKCSLTHGIKKRVYCREWAPYCQNSSPSVFLSPECSTAVLSCTCPDRLGECHSNFEHTRNTNSLHHRHICVVLQDVFASREKISKSVRLYLYICIFCFLFFPFFWKVKVLLTWAHSLKQRGLSLGVKVNSTSHHHYTKSFFMITYALAWGWI